MPATLQSAHAACGRDRNNAHTTPARGVAQQIYSKSNRQVEEKIVNIIRIAKAPEKKNRRRTGMVQYKLVEKSKIGPEKEETSSIILGFNNDSLEEVQ